MARRKTILENVEIIDIGDKGSSIGRTSEGEIVIIQKDAVPGDRADILILKKKKGLRHGVVSKFIKLSENRRPPFCSHFGSCGGCKWQHLDYNFQLSFKEKAVREAVKRLAKDSAGKVENIRSARNQRHYRNKMEYSFSTKRWLSVEEIRSGIQYEQRNALGFHVAGAFDKVLKIDHCYLQDGFGNEIRNFLNSEAQKRNWSYYDFHDHKGFLRNLILRNTSLEEWMVTLVFGEHDHLKIAEVFECLMSKFPSVASWNYLVNTKRNSSLFDIETVHYSGAEFITEKLGDIQYRISPKSFFQTNSEQARLLYDLVLELTDMKGNEVVYDLYTGTGSIALYLARHCKSVVGIEEVSEAIADAHQNLTVNNIANIHFLVGDVKEVLDPGFAEKFGMPDVVVTDPPRAGMHPDVVNTLLKLLPARIVYISCNPSTQARDIALLKEKYELKRLVPVDMFPHTSHIEAVALLHRIRD